MKSKEIIEQEIDLKEITSCHTVWHKFSNWMTKTFGSDLYGEWKVMEVPGKNGKMKKAFRYRDFNEYTFSQRLSGYETMVKIEKYVKRFCPEIKVVPCDDSVYAGSYILLVPHPKHGITVMFIPQCTSIQNQFFLYENHYKKLMSALREMKHVYKDSL